MKKSNQKQLTVEDIKTVELKDYKDLGYDDSQRFEASLYINEQRVAIVSNDGGGGNHHYLWFDGRDKTEKVLHEYLHKLIKEGRFDETYKYYVEDIFPDGEAPPIETFMGIDDYINQLIDEFNLKKECKRNTCYTLHSDEWGVHQGYKEPYSKKTKLMLIEMYGENLKEILNERFVEPIEI